jgi:hypothetical protein
MPRHATWAGTRVEDIMTRTVGKLGKLAPQFPTAVKEMHCYATAPLPAAPPSVDYTKHIPGGFPMDGNDKYGIDVAALRQDLTHV